MDAVILAGAVAKGAFAAGALAVLLDPAEHPQGLRIRRVVGASSGALTGAYLAAAVRQGTTTHAGAALRALWMERAVAEQTFSPSLRGLVRAEGFSTHDKLRALLRGQIRPAAAAAPVDLRIVTTSPVGEVRPGVAPIASTYEHVEAFDGTAFDTTGGHERVYDAVLASASFPFVFLPSPVDMNGRPVPSFDGGIVNNAPVKHAIDDPQIERVFVIASYPRVSEPHVEDRRGLGLVAHLVDILVNERLYRDLREAHETNRALAELEQHVTSPALRDVILASIGWRGRRRVEIVEVRPSGSLDGNAFAGLFSRELRASYIEAGELAARAALRELYP
jgi:predicted acylesterase/phospholipase RssA